MPRTYGSGRLYVKSGAYYARWRTPDGRYLNRRLGKVRARGETEGLTRTEAERAIRRLMEQASAKHDVARVAARQERADASKHLLSKDDRGRELRVDAL